MLSSSKRYIGPAGTIFMCTLARPQLEFLLDSYKQVRFEIAKNIDKLQEFAKKIYIETYDKKDAYIRAWLDNYNNATVIYEVIKNLWNELENYTRACFDELNKIEKTMRDTKKQLRVFAEQVNELLEIPWLVPKCDIRQRNNALTSNTTNVLQIEGSNLTPPAIQQRSTPQIEEILSKDIKIGKDNSTTVDDGALNLPVLHVSTNEQENNKHMVIGDFVLTTGNNNTFDNMGIHNEVVINCLKRLIFRSGQRHVTSQIIDEIMIIIDNRSISLLPDELTKNPQFNAFFEEYFKLKMQCVKILNACYKELSLSDKVSYRQIKNIYRDKMANIKIYDPNSLIGTCIAQFNLLQNSYDKLKDFLWEHDTKFTQEVLSKYLDQYAGPSLKELLVNVSENKGLIGLLAAIANVINRDIFIWQFSPEKELVLYGQTFNPTAERIHLLFESPSKPLQRLVYENDKMLKAKDTMEMKRLMKINVLSLFDREEDDKLKKAFEEIFIIRKTQKLDNNDRKLLSNVIMQSNNVNCVLSDGWSLLCKTIYVGDAYLTELLLKNGAEPDHMIQTKDNSDGLTPLSLSILTCNNVKGECIKIEAEVIKMVELLLNYGASANHTCKGLYNGFTPLLLAICNFAQLAESHKVVDLLLRFGANVNYYLSIANEKIKDYNEFIKYSSPLCIALINSNKRNTFQSVLEITRLLLNFNAIIKYKSPKYGSSLEIAQRFYRNTEIEKLLLKHVEFLKTDIVEGEVNALNELFFTSLDVKLQENNQLCSNLVTLNNFRWVINNCLARSAAPAYKGYDRVQVVTNDIVEFLIKNKIRRIISLNSCDITRESRDLLLKNKITHEWYPIDDFGIPTIDQFNTIIVSLNENKARNIITLVHCGAGQGRTGMILTLWQISNNKVKSKKDLIELMKNNNVETASQKTFIENYYNNYFLNAAQFKNVKWVEYKKILRSSRPYYKSGDALQIIDENVIHFLDQNGVKAILSLNACPIQDEKNLLSKCGISYKWIKIKNESVCSKNDLNAILEFLSDNYSNNKCTLIYCNAGIGRTGFIVTIWLIANNDRYNCFNNESELKALIESTGAESEEQKQFLLTYGQKYLCRSNIPSIKETHKRMLLGKQSEQKLETHILQEILRKADIIPKANQNKDIVSIVFTDHNLVKQFGEELNKIGISSLTMINEPRKPEVVISKDGKDDLYIIYLTGDEYNTILDDRNGYAKLISSYHPDKLLILNQ